MADKRMFAKSIIDSDPFLDMPLSAQALYFHLGMRADDDGVINSPNKIRRMVGAEQEDLEVLADAGFIIPFDSGIVIIKHWLINNHLRADRKKDTLYPEEFAQLEVKENGAYTLKISTKCLTSDGQLTTKCQPTDNQVSDNCLTSDGQVSDNCPHSIDKYSIDKISIDKDSIGEGIETVPRPSKDRVKKYGEYNNVLLSDSELEKLRTEYSDLDDRIERLSSYMASTGKKYKSHYATIRAWARKDAEKKDAKKNEGAQELDEYYSMVSDWVNKE